MPLIDVFGTSRPKKQKTATLPDLSPDEQDSLLRGIANKSLGAASAVGNVLDTVRGATWDALQGKNPLPGVFNPSERTSGTDLINGKGINHPGISDDLMGFAAEVLGDPLTYMTLGGSAVSKAGQLAKKLGLLGDASKVASQAAGKTVGKRVARMTTNLGDLLTHAGPEAVTKAEDLVGGAAKLSELSGDKLGGLVGIGLPFKDPAFTLGKGALSQKIAGGMDAIGSAARWSPVGRALAMGFSPDAGGRFTRAGQEGAAAARQAENIGRADVLGKAFDVQHRLAALGLPPDQLTRILDRMVEVPGGVIDPTVGKHSAAAAAELASLPPNVQQELQSVVTDMQSHQAATRQRSVDMGNYVQELSSEHTGQYSARFANAAGGPSASRPGGLLFDTTFGKGRKAFLDIPEGRSAIEALATDPNVVAGRTTKPLQAARHVLNNYLGVSNNDVLKSFDFQKQLKEDTFAKVMGDPGLPDAVRKQMADHIAGIKAKQKQAKELANYFGKRDAKRFYGDPVGDYLTYQLKRSKTNAHSDEMLKFMAQHAAPVGGDGIVPIADILKGSNFVLPGGTAVDPNALAMLAKHGVNDITAAGLPANVAEELLKSMKSSTTSSVLDPLKEMVDSETNWVKGLWTTPWAAFHGRNAATGVTNQLYESGVNPTHARAIGQFINGKAKDLAGAGEIPAIKRALIDRGLPNTPENATKIAQEFAYQHEIIKPYMGQGASVDPNFAPDTIGNFTKSVPGREKPAPFSEVIKDFFTVSPESTRNPRDMRGVKNYKTGEIRTESKFGPVMAGEKLGQRIENSNRLQPFYELLFQGVDPAEAAKRAITSNVDYSSRAYTEFEKKYLTRLFPFYKYSSRTAPLVMKRLMEHPGGGTAQTIRLTNDLKDESGFTPDYIGGGLAIPIPGGKEGIQKYLTGLGFQHEILNNLATAGPGGIQKTGMDLLGQLHPVPKTALELATGKQFFTGRDLKDLDARSGRIGEQTGLLESPKSVPYWMDELLMNSPAARAVSTVGQLVDSRKSVLQKAVNLLTGVRTSDVDVEKQKEISARKIIEEMLRGQPGVGRHESLYVSPENAATMDPATLQLMALLKSIQKQSAARRKERSAP